MKLPIESSNHSRQRKTMGRLALLVLLLVICYLLLLSLPTRVYEAGDFLGYWAAANLLAHGQSPYDPEALLRVEREQGWQGDEPVYSWNPPWLHVLLLPLGVLPFRSAAALWFLINPLLVGASVLLLRETVTQPAGHRLVALPLIAAFLFSRTLHALLEGQINTLILLGCAIFLALAGNRRDYLAGAALVLATVKPHVSYLLVPGILTLMLLKRRWRVIAGFIVFLSIPLSLASWLYPDWLASYLRLFDVSASPLLSTRYATPTLRGLLRSSLGIDVGFSLSALSLVAFLGFVWLRRGRLALSVIVSLSLIVGLPTSPFGWSTDQVVLLIPIALAIMWAQRLPPVARRIPAVLLLLTYGYSLWVWLFNYRDILFVVVPPLIGLLWSYVYLAVLPDAQMASKIALTRGEQVERQTSTSQQTT
jgi:hypothetical protein